jgi:hypothetical protein
MYWRYIQENIKPNTSMGLMIRQRPAQIEDARVMAKGLHV